MSAAGARWPVLTMRVVNPRVARTRRAYPHARTMSRGRVGDSFRQGIDAAKSKHAVAVAEPGRDGEVRYSRGPGQRGGGAELPTRLRRRHRKLHVCYEAGPTGYGSTRQIVGLGHQCTVIAPSLIPARRRPVKTNRRDAVQLARLLRAGELTAVWVPGRRARGHTRPGAGTRAAVDDLRRKRQVISSLLLKHGRVFPGKKTWGATYVRWLQQQTFTHPAQQVVLQEMVLAERHARERLARIETAITELLPSWSWRRWSMRCRRCAASAW